MQYRVLTRHEAKTTRQMGNTVYISKQGHSAPVLLRKKALFNLET